MIATPWDSAPRCSFYVRVTVTEDPPTYRYDQVHTDGGSLRLVGPPLVGDLVLLSGDVNVPRPRHTGTHRVIDRSWTYSQRGSGDWPRGDPHPGIGPLLWLIVVKDDGPFRNEA